MLEPTLRALAALRASEAMPLGQGLSAENAAACLHQAIRPFNPQTLAAAVEAAGSVPDRVAIVVPAGVFTTPIEWVAIGVAAGAQVHQGTCHRPRAVQEAHRLLPGRGSSRHLQRRPRLACRRRHPCVRRDSTIDAIVADYPDVPVIRYGHRFSLAFVGESEAPQGPLALDITRCDSRGCMAPPPSSRPPTRRHWRPHSCPSCSRWSSEHRAVRSSPRMDRSGVGVLVWREYSAP